MRRSARGTAKLVDDLLRRELLLDHSLSSLI